MNLLKTGKIFFVVVTLFFIGGSTFATRIRANPQSFGPLTPPQQTLVKAGQVSLGLPAFGEAVVTALWDVRLRARRVPMARAVS